MKVDRVNNFDLIRLLAAFQVVIFHSYEHLNLNNRYFEFIIENFLEFFPGVPVFFFISGFLIYASFDRNHDKIKQYFRNRILRIFPALWVCTLVAILLLCLASVNGFWFLFSQNEFLLWIAGQVSFFQFYTPDILRFWGVGAPNGSLWTITVEFQFYLIIPLIYFILRLFEKKWIALLILFILSCFFNYFINTLNDELLLNKLLGLTVFAFLHYFLIGVAAFIYWKKAYNFFTGNVLIWLFIYLAFMVFTKCYLELPTASYDITSIYNIIADLLLSAVTLSAAFSFKSLSSKLLNGNDISYGIYIYHMLVVNWLVHHNFVGNLIYLPFVIVVVTAAAIISWKFIEKPALSLK